MRFTGHGHEHIRATHPKTLELTPAEQITARATCVIATGVRAQPAQPLAGRVRITIRAGGMSFTLFALANSSWDPTGPAVIRRSALRLPGTLATDADHASSDLPRPLVAAMTSPGVVIEVTVEPAGAERDTVVLFAADPTEASHARLRIEEDAADVVLAEDAEARRVITRTSGAGTGVGATRTLVVATDGLPGASVRARLAHAAVEVVGLPSSLTVVAASPSSGAVVIVPDDVDPRELLRRTPVGQRLALTTTTDRLPALIEFATAHRGNLGATIAVPYGPPIRVAAVDTPDLPGRSPVHVCFDSTTEEGALDPPIGAAIEALLSDGVATRAAADALAQLTGWPRRRAYATVLELAARRAGGATTAT